MIEPRQPLISIVTPVYNGEKYLEECIESVLRQTYANWEYVIVNNCSTDRTEEIVRSYEDRDSRVRLKNNDRFLKQMENFNEAARTVSTESRYCFLLMADDWVYPRFLEETVAVAEEYPTIGIVSSYQLVGSQVKNVKIPPDTRFLPGREVARRKLLESDKNLFGSTSSFLLRSDVLKGDEKVFDESEIHADTDFVMRILKEWDFGFVHQILSHTRIHGESTSSFGERFGTLAVSYLSRVVRYGAVYLESDERDKVLERCLNRHHQQVIQRLFSKNRKEVWRYHRAELKRLGVDYDWTIFAKQFARELFRFLSGGGRKRQWDEENEAMRFKRETTV